MAATLAALAAGTAVAAIGARRGSLLAELEPRSLPTTGGSLLARVGSLPLLRRMGASGRDVRRVRAARVAWGGREIVGARALAALAASVTSAALGLGWLCVPIGAVGWRVPGVALERRVRRRRAEADREVPVLLDLLAVATSAGLPPQLALRRAVEAAEGPLAEELSVALRASDLGGRWREELSRAAGRLGLPDLDRLVGSLTRSEALGSSLEEEIARLAADVREARRAAATERARAAPVKMLFPLVFLVLPAFLLLTVAPVLLTTVRSIG